MGSSVATVRFSSGKEGLNGNEVTAQVTAASGMGNSEIAIKGEDAQGDSITGNNEDFSLAVELQSLPGRAISAAQQMIEHFLSLVRSEVIKIPKTTAATQDKLSNYFPD